MRLGYLNGVDNYWFSGLGETDPFEMLDPFSANPTITLRDKVYGKTAEELPAISAMQRGWASLNIPAFQTAHNYTSSDDPYWNSNSPQQWNQIVSDAQSQAQIFKLTS